MVSGRCMATPLSEQFELARRFSTHKRPSQDMYDPAVGTGSGYRGAVSRPGARGSSSHESHRRAMSPRFRATYGVHPSRDLTEDRVRIKRRRPTVSIGGCTPG